MGLDFTDIPDRQGPAIYIVGATMLESQLQPWRDRLAAILPPESQVIYVDINSSNGAKISEFYEIEPEKLPAIMIVMDDDTIYKSWFGPDLPSVETVTYEHAQITGSGQA